MKRGNNFLFIFIFILLVISYTHIASAQVDVTSTGGTSPVSYTTLYNAFTAIN